MTDEFLSGGLQNDRYLKALRLVEQFEDEIEATLHEFGQEMVAQHPGLFDEGPDPHVKTNRDPGSALAYQRHHYEFTGPRAPEVDQTQYLNVHLYWMPPTEYNRTDVDGALRAFGYKIKNADKDVDRRVEELTHSGDWAVRTSGNPYDSNTTFYRHVDSAEEIQECAETLVSHFSEFGELWAIDE